MWICVAGLATVGPAGAEAQIRERFTLTWDAVAGSEYVWRGIVRANTWLWQADAYATWTFGSVETRHLHIRHPGFTAGIWAGFTGGVPQDRRGDRADFGLAELNPWAQIGASVGAADLALGVTRYYYRGEPDRPFGRSAARNTTELYGRLLIPGSRVAGGATLWWDVDQVRGGYLETSVALNLPFIPFPIPAARFLRLDPTFGNVFLDVTAGFSLGQGVDDDPFANFAGTGLTHVDFALSSSILWSGVLSTDVALHVQVNDDARTWFTEPFESHAMLVYVEFAVRPLRFVSVAGAP